MAQQDRRPRILVIDESAEVAEMLCELFGEERIETSVCLHGAGAIPLVRELPPDLIVLETRLSRANGWHILTAIKVDPATARIPMLICSAARHEVQQMAGWLIRHRCEILYRPFDAGELLLKVRRLLGIELAAGHSERADEGKTYHSSCSLPDHPALTVEHVPSR